MRSLKAVVKGTETSEDQSENSSSDHQPLTRCIGTWAAIKRLIAQISNAALIHVVNIPLSKPTALLQLHINPASKFGICFRIDTRLRASDVGQSPLASQSSFLAV